jgi:formylglycine-generating enzyme required for sulfatase activity
LGELVRRTGARVRLPTEAAWEWACRAGTTTAFFFGDTASVDRANYDGSDTCGPGSVKGVFRETTTPVGSFPPNAWGLHDMHGNIREWCEDWSAVYPAGEVRDPRGDEHGHARVVRGGSWYDEPRLCRSASRIAFVPHYGDDCFGCRVLLCLD